MVAHMVTSPYDRASWAYRVTCGAAANSSPARTPVTAGAGSRAARARRLPIAAVNTAATAIASTDGSRSAASEMPATAIQACMNV